jgi:hypothetical protein
MSSRRVRAAAVAALASAALGLAVPAADAACPASLTSTPFAQFGDQAQYTLAPGGSFESGAPGWSLTRAAVVEGNESYGLVPGSHSLAIGAGGQAVSPWVCISSEYPTFRVMTKQLTGGGPLNVSLQYVNALGLAVNLGVASLDTGPDWAPSPPMRLGSSLPLWLPGSSLQVRLVFQPSWTSSWAIDDVFLDPYSRR